MIEYIIRLGNTYDRSAFTLLLYSLPRSISTQKLIFLSVPPSNFASEPSHRDGWSLLYRHTVGPCFCTICYCIYILYMVQYALSHKAIVGAM